MQSHGSWCGMSRELQALMAALMLAGCAPEAKVAMPAAGTPVVIVSSGGAFSGATVTRIFEGDMVAQETYQPGVEKPEVTVTAGRPHVYADVVALLAKEGPRAKARMAAHPDMCLDYGSDAVEAIPPVAHFDAVWTACPDKAVTKLMDDVLATLAPHVP